MKSDVIDGIRHSPAASNIRNDPRYRNSAEVEILIGDVSNQEQQKTLLDAKHQLGTGRGRDAGCHQGRTHLESQVLRRGRCSGGLRTKLSRQSHHQLSSASSALDQLDPTGLAT